MENHGGVPILIPYDPAEFWRMMRELVREEIDSLKNQSASKLVSTEVKGLIEKPLYKMSEICKLLSISRPTIYEWIKLGKLKPVKIRSRIFFLGKDILELITPGKII